MIRISQKQLDLKKIREIYKTCIVDKVLDGIYDFDKKMSKYRPDFDNKAPKECRIAAGFLVKHGLYDESGLSDSGLTKDVLKGKILAYVLGGKEEPQEYLEKIIVSFWRCAANVCADNSENLTEEDIAVLSKWERIRKKALQQTDREKREKILQDAYALFSDTAKKGMDEKAFKTIEPIPGMGAAMTQALKFLEEIFAYDDIMNRTLAAGSPRHQVMSAMDVPVCPYCNRQYITLYQEKDKGTEEEEKEAEEKKKGKKEKKTKVKNPVNKTSADLDHFYIKDKYPYLSLSLYNFIPSCQICNSRFKGAADFYVYPHVYPYQQEFGDAVKFSMLAADSQTDGRGKIELEYSPRNEAVKNSISTFSLEQVYQSHAVYVQELQQKAHRYNMKTIKSMNVDFSDLLEGERDILNELYGQYLERSKFYQRPLAKLTRDILDDCYKDEVDWDEK